MYTVAKSRASFSNPMSPDGGVVLCVYGLLHAITAYFNYVNHKSYRRSHQVLSKRQRRAVREIRKLAGDVGEIRASSLNLLG